MDPRDAQIVQCPNPQFVELELICHCEPLPPDVHRLLFAPDTGLVPGVLTGLEAPSSPEAATVADVPTWRVTGTSPALVTKTWSPAPRATAVATVA